MSIKINNQNHVFYLVDPISWSLVVALSALMLTFGGVLYSHGYFCGVFLYKVGFVIMYLVILSIWWRDIIRRGLRITMIFLLFRKLYFFSRLF